MKSLKANVLCTLGIALAIFSVGCGDAIQKSQSTVEMFGYVFLSCCFLAAALVLCAIGVSSENERIERELYECENYIKLCQSILRGYLSRLNFDKLKFKLKLSNNSIPVFVKSLIVLVSRFGYINRFHLISDEVSSTWMPGAVNTPFIKKLECVPFTFSS